MFLGAARVFRARADRMPGPRLLCVVTGLIAVLVRGVSAADTIVVPDTPVGRQLAWFVATLNSGEVLRTSSVSEHFAPTPFQQPAGNVRGFNMAAEAIAPVTLAGFADTLSANELVAILRDRQGEAHRLALETDPYSGHRISVWTIRPGEPLKRNEIGGKTWNPSRGGPL